MATARKIKSELLTCSICFETFTEPKTLPCLHSFCCKCLSRYIQAEEEMIGVIRKGGFPCPVCRNFTHVSDTLKPIQVWAGQFKTNFYIQRLNSVIGFTEETERPEVHTEITSSNKTEQTFQNAVEIASQNGHVDNRLEPTAPPISARTSAVTYPRPTQPRRVYLPPAISSNDYFWGRWRNSYSARKRAKQPYPWNPSLFHTITATEDVSVPSSLFHTPHGGDISASVPPPHMSAQYGLRVHLPPPVTSNTFNTGILDLFSTSRQANVSASPRQSNSTALIPSTDRSSPVTRTVTPSNLTSLSLTARGEGTADLSAQSSRDQSSVGLGDRTFTSSEISMDESLIRLDQHGNEYQGAGAEEHYRYASGRGMKLSVKCKCDKHNPMLSDICLLENGQCLVTTDYNNCSVKTIRSWLPDQKHLKKKASIGLSGRPYCLTPVTNTTAAVTVPQNFVICIISVRSYAAETKMIKTKKPYRGIAFLSHINTFVVGNIQTPPSLDIINDNGDVLKTICRDTCGRFVVSAPYNIIVDNRGRILVSDSGKKALLRFTPEGVLEKTYKPGQNRLRSPAGLCCTASGDVFLVDYGVDTLFLIHSEGDMADDRVVPEPLLFLDKPASVCIGNDGTLYIAHWSGKIKIFTKDIV